MKARFPTAPRSRVKSAVAALGGLLFGLDTIVISAATHALAELATLPAAVA